MKKLFLYILGCLPCLSALAHPDSVVVPLVRQRFHDRIREEQVLCDKADGKLDHLIRVNNNPEINQAVTDAIFRKINELKDQIELSPKIVTNNDKITQLRFVEQLLINFRLDWKLRRFNAVQTPELVDNFQQILFVNIDSLSMAPLINSTSYQVGKINAEIFRTNKGYAESGRILYLKYCALHPEKILTTIRPWVQESFADSLIRKEARRDPKNLYDYASASNSPEGKLIHRSTDSLVSTIVRLTKTSNALLYFPFLDDLVSGKQQIDSIRKLVGDGENGYDSVGYFKLLVKTEIGYYSRLIRKDTPVAMIGVNGLREMLRKKAIQHFVTRINELHEQSNLNVRMKSIEPLSAEEIYYMMVMGENDIYTSSYKHSFARLLARLGVQPRGDQLLLNVNMDYFRKFIKMAANFNQLDTFLRTMPNTNANLLMKGFVSRLEESDNLEDAVDVADSYSSIRNKQLQQNMLTNVAENETRSIEFNNQKGKITYSLLKLIFESADSNQIDLTSKIGIPSIFSIDNKYLSDDSGRIVEQVFFYGDEDGKAFFTPFINSFNPKDWQITPKKEWYEIKSLRGNKVWVFANRPLDSDKNLDDSAQVHLGKYLSNNDMLPSIVVHRGHSYWLPGTINRMAGGAKVILLGSCGGYKNLNEILEVCPDAHIISTKEIGKGDINRPILNYLNQTLQTSKTLVWKDMWTALTKIFEADPSKEMRESWEDYIPPYKNLGAIFIKAYNKKLEEEKAL